MEWIANLSGWWLVLGCIGCPIIMLVGYVVGFALAQGNSAVKVWSGVVVIILAIIAGLVTFSSYIVLVIKIILAIINWAQA